MEWLIAAGWPAIVDFLAQDWLGKPVWAWTAFLAAVIALLAFDLGVLHRTPRAVSAHESLVMSVVYIGLGLTFGGFVWAQFGQTAGVDYLTAFVVEKTLAIDNVFVIALIFGYFAVPRELQHRVLFWGVLGVIVLRGIMIGAGAALVANFAWTLWIFAAFLIATGVKMLFMSEAPTDLSQNALLKFMRRRLRVTDSFHGQRFFVRLPDSTGRVVLHATPLFLALALIEFADLIFAVDSVPAIFAITSDPFVVYTSNIFAILGLRALFFALAAMIARFRYLKPALALVLIFIGGKVFAADLLGFDKVPPALSLGVTFALLGGGVLWSLWRSRGEGGAQAAPDAARERG
ncbi:MAG: TerC family protein [Methylobacteriaceae bacterium]|nr:TerC family protein [Methylobacteriaceae bacterium]